MNLMGKPPLGLKGSPQAKAPRKPIKQGANKSTITRRSANGESCTIRGQGCVHTGTVVFCHYRRFGWAGTAEKPKDFLGAYGCHVCHDALDGRRGPPISDADMLRAMGETLMIMHAKGILVIKE